MSRAFFDTNMLVYMFETGSAKQRRVLEIAEHGGVISVQCLNEFANVALKKLGFDWPEIHASNEQIAEICPTVIPLDTDLHAIGLRLAEKHRFAIYDSMIVAAALQAGCDLLYSEDMQHGLVIDARLTITNPFATP